MIKKYILKSNSEPLSNWINSVLKNHLKCNLENENEVNYIIDYFSRSGDKVTPRISYDAAVLKANQWLAKLLAIKNDKGACDFDIEHSFGNGFNLVKINSNDGLVFEGKQMLHCVGSYSVTKSDFFSLRDSANNSHVTLQIKDDILIQVQGKANGPIEEKDKELLKEFIIKKDLSVKRTEGVKIDLYSLSVDFYLKTFVEFCKIEGFSFDKNSKSNNVYFSPKDKIVVDLKKKPNLNDLIRKDLISLGVGINSEDLVNFCYQPKTNLDISILVVTEAINHDNYKIFDLLLKAKKWELWELEAILHWPDLMWAPNFKYLKRLSFFWFKLFQKDEKKSFAEDPTKKEEVAALNQLVEKGFLLLPKIHCSRFSPEFNAKAIGYAVSNSSDGVWKIHPIYSALNKGFSMWESSSMVKYNGMPIVLFKDKVSKCQASGREVCVTDKQKLDCCHTDYKNIIPLVLADNKSHSL